MSDAEDEFRPRLGRIRSAGGRIAKRYVAKVAVSAEKAVPGAFAKRSKTRFTGARIGRGAGVGAALSSRGHPFAKLRSRRVAVKIRSVRLGSLGLGKARAHLHYIQRDGASRDGGRGALYGPTQDHVDGGAFLAEGSSDRHQFRIILAPEDAGELEDLRQFTRDVMAVAEKDLGTRLDWVAVNHFHTDHPHVHVVLRGRADDGGDLVIARNYITYGFRRRAEELATLELGPRRDLDIARSRAAEVEREAFMKLDQELLQRAGSGTLQLSPPATPYDRFEHQLLAGRLKTLQSMGLALRDADGWRLSPDMEARLREAGRRGDIIRSMGAELGENLAPHAVRDFARETSVTRLIGRVAGLGATEESHERRFLAIEGADGAQWHVPIDLAPGAAPPKGAVVEITRATAAPRASDRTIAEVAMSFGGVYSDANHSAIDPSACAEFLLAHKRRLEALRRTGHVERAADRSWRIPKDFAERAAAHDADRSTARVRVLSWAALDQLPGAAAVTFLDDALEGRIKIERVAHDFGAELDQALAARRRWLLAEGIGREGEEGLKIDRGRLRMLARDAVNEVAAGLARDLGKAHAPVPIGERVEGVYRRLIDLPTGRFALIERSKEFALVPWREVLERQRGLEVIGSVRAKGISWDFGRKRAGPGV